MFLSLCAQQFDPAGAILLDVDPDSGIDPGGRRVNRTPTLDGFAVIDDRGFTASDTTLTATFPLSAETEQTLLRLAKLHARCTVATRYGCYLGALEFVRYDRGRGSISFIIEKQLSA